MLKCDDIFFINYIFKNVMFLLFLRIYDVMKVIVISCFLLIAYLKMTYFYYFLWIRNNYDDIFFANCVFKNDMFMYVLLYHLYQPNY